MNSSQEIVERFVNSGFHHMDNIPNNRVFYTDNSASTIVWVEKNVVIEYYLLFPNKFTPLHSHPFKNQIIFMGGDLTGRTKKDKDSPIMTVHFTKDMIGKIRSILPEGFEHGFETGPLGAVVYNIQYWPENVVNPLSAALNYFGEPMGEIHERFLKLCKQ